MGIQDRYLLLQLVRQPGVIGVQEGDVLAPSVGYAKIAGSAPSPVLVPRVLQVAHLLGVPLSIPQGDLGATVGRTVVHQQEFPVIVALGQHALDRLLDELLLIEEGSDYRDQRLAYV